MVLRMLLTNILSQTIYKIAISNKKGWGDIHTEQLDKNIFINNGTEASP